jgi:hypothetical protein
MDAQYTPAYRLIWKALNLFLARHFIFVKNSIKLSHLYNLLSEYDQPHVLTHSGISSHFNHQPINQGAETEPETTVSFDVSDNSLVLTDCL